ncbi:uncharacterized protein [Miscanthus floridulus]|uniref:uncharacterized protein n=1 Tax=Miscanthus floridulus TaxID=154761 RepID=UPI0034589993
MSFEVVYGRPPPTMASYQPGLSRVAALDKQLTNRDEFLSATRERLLQTQSIMKLSHDASHRDVSFSVDDWVWLRLHQRAATANKSSHNAKLVPPRYYGPFKVIECIGLVAYRLQLSDKACIHNVFHVVFLKKYHGTAPTDIVPLPMVVHGHAVPEPGHIVRTRLNHGVWEILVHWLGQSSADSTWELLNDFKTTYPKF